MATTFSGNNPHIRVNMRKFKLIKNIIDNQLLSIIDNQ